MICIPGMMDFMLSRIKPDNRFISEKCSYCHTKNVSLKYISVHIYDCFFIYWSIPFVRLLLSYICMILSIYKKLHFLILMNFICIFFDIFIWLSSFFRQHETIKRDSNVLLQPTLAMQSKNMSKIDILHCDKITSIHLYE